MSGSTRVTNVATAVVVLVLGGLLVVGGVVGAVRELREDDRSVPLPQIGVVLLVVVGMHRAVRVLRRVDQR